MTRSTDGKPRTWSRLPLRLLLCASLCSAVACSDDDEETTASGDDSTSGGESGGLQNADGSQEPLDDGNEPAGSQGSGQSGSGSSESGGSSPWGATRAEECAAPARRAVSATATRSVAEGIRAANSGNVQAAESAFRRALTEDAQAYSAAYNLGVLEDRAGRDTRALEFYRQALRMVPDYEAAAEGLVTIHIRQNSVPEAVSFLEPIANRYTTNLALQALMSEVYTRAGRFDDAWTAARRALRCDERFVPALIALVNASTAQGREELAKSILEQALSVDPGNAELHFMRGVMLRKEEARFREALEEFGRAVQIRPDYVDARVALGIAQLAGGNYTEAVANFEAAARLSPQLVAVHLNLGESYRASRQWERAKASFDRALQMDSTLAQVHFNMGLMYMSAGAEFPGLDQLTALQRAKESFTSYQSMMGARLPRGDLSTQMLEDLNRQIEREQRRIERERRAAERAATEGGGA